MSVQNQTASIDGVYLDFKSNTAMVDVSFTDSDDNTGIGGIRCFLPVSGAVTDAKGRTVAATTPANVISSAATFKTNLIAALNAAIALNKVKP